MNKAALFPLTALIALACAAPTEGDDDDSSGGGPTYATTGGTTGTGGVVNTGTGGATGTGGVTSSGGTVGTGGTTPIGSGGVAGGTGGAAAAACSASAFTVAAGYVDNGQICGYAWTAKFPETDAAVTIDPPCAVGDGSDCFTGADLCTTATVPASTAEPAYYPGVIIGVNAAQGSAGGTNGSWTATGAGLTATFTAPAGASVRVVVKSGTSEYCADATSGVAIPWAGFSVNCWEAGGATLSAGSPISQVMLQLNGGAAAQTAVNFCLDNLTVN